MKPIEVETTLRGRNQLTVPREIAEAFGLREGQRLTFAVDPSRPDEIVVKPMRESYAGILTGIFGATEAERESYVKGERDSWI